MGHTYGELFKNIKYVELPSGFEAQVLSHIEAFQLRRTRIRTWSFGGASLCALALTILIGNSLYSALARSGFYEYVSLVFSADGTLFSYWKELGISILESTPILGMIILLAAVTLCIWTCAQAMTSSRRHHHVLYA